MVNPEEYQLTPEQIKACRAVERAVKKAQKAGVHILTKSYSLVGYSKKAFSEGLVSDLHDRSSADYSNPVPDYTICNIDGGGADDMEYFKK